MNHSLGPNFAKLCNLAQAILELAIFWLKTHQKWNQNRKIELFFFVIGSFNFPISVRSVRIIRNQHRLSNFFNHLFCLTSTQFEKNEFMVTNFVGFNIITSPSININRSILKG